MPAEPEDDPAEWILKQPGTLPPAPPALEPEDDPAEWILKRLRQAYEVQLGG